MSFFENLKHALGFGNHESDEEDFEGIDARVIPLRERTNAAGDSHSTPGCTAIVAASHMVECEARVAAMAGALVQSEGAASGTPEQEVEAAVPNEIFTSVVKIFNETLPDFLKSTVDEKLQREYLYDALSASMKEHLQSLSEVAREECNRRYETERINMHREMETLRQKSQKVESDSADSKKLQLSAERQKRALNERISEMEKKLATLQAENEQYVLENKSLINKVRLAAVQGGEGNVAVADLVAGAEQSARIEQLTEANAQLTETNIHLSELSDQLTSTVAQLGEEVQRLTAENARLTAMAEKAQREAKENLVAIGMSRSKHSAAIAEMQQTLEKAQGVADLRIQELEAKLADVTAEYTSMQEELADAKEQLDVVNEINSRLERLEEAKMANELQLRRQKEELAVKDEQLHSLQAEINGYAEALVQKERLITTLETSAESLRKTLDENAYNHTQAEGAMRAEIERLRSMRTTVAADEDAAIYTPTPIAVPDPEPVAEVRAPRSTRTSRRAPAPAQEEMLLDFTFFDPEGNELHNPENPAPAKPEVIDLDTSEAPAPKRGRRPKAERKPAKVKISAIDTTLEDTDWLLATPPPKRKGDPANLDPAASTPEFGYQEPAKKAPIPDNPAQMSLW